MNSDLRDAAARIVDVAWEKGSLPRVVALVAETGVTEEELREFLTEEADRMLQRGVIETNTPLRNAFVALGLNCFLVGVDYQRRIG